jgi:hypothetical protein
MASINWGQIGSTLAGITGALTAAGVNGSSQNPILNQIGLLINPNVTQELALCQQLLQFAGNPQIEAQLAMQLATKQGLPPAAAALALTLTQPGVDVPTRVLQIEQIIRSGG